MLEVTLLKKLNDNKKCFILTSNNKEAELCGLENAKGDFVEEWNTDFFLFRDKCQITKPEIQLNKNEEKELDNKFKEKIAEVKLELIRERTKKIRGEFLKNEQNVLENKVKKVETVALQAVKKELSLERLLEKEENEKEETEMKELEKQVENEKKKDECLRKAIKQKELEDQHNLARSETEKKIQKLKEEAKREIIRKRNELRQKILLMRKKQQRKKNLLKAKVLTMRSKMAMDLQKLTREGSKSRCKIKGNESAQINAYCHANFVDDYYKLVECQQPENFCYMCCENEFGEVHLSKREGCYNMCDDLDRPQYKSS